MPFRDAILFHIIEESQTITLDMTRYRGAPRGGRKWPCDAPLQHDIKQKNLRSSQHTNVILVCDRV
jgi:hypothetical protein